MRRRGAESVAKRGRQRTDMLWALLIAVMVFALTTCGNAQMESKKEMVVVTHTVSRGETLWTVAEKYMTSDRYILEFIEGIYELNYEHVFADRERAGTPRKAIYPGDRLEIRYWRDKQHDGL